MGYTLETLEMSVNSAIGVLAPKFGIGEAELRRCPEVAVEVKDADFSHYSPLRRKIILRPGQVNNALALGEEVSHYLHDQINWRIGTSPNEYSSEIISRESIMECVGRYGALVYIQSRGEDYERLKTLIAADLRMSPKKWDYRTQVTREFGYEYAELLFGMFGEAFLPELARMGREKALDSIGLRLNRRRGSHDLLVPKGHPFDLPTPSSLSFI